MHSFLWRIMKNFICSIGLLLIGANLVAAEPTNTPIEPTKTNCHCKNCACTKDKHCGCFSDAGCKCSAASTDMEAKTICGCATENSNISK